jgi:hypothetical protein
VMVTCEPCTGYGTVKQRDKPPKTKRKFCPKKKGRKGPNTRRKGFKTRGKWRLWRRESALCPREPERQGRRSMGRVWAGPGLVSLKKVSRLKIVISAGKSQPVKLVKSTQLCLLFSTVSVYSFTTVRSTQYLPTP